ncbi:MAG: oleate hydratase, partial [Deltaproteobacteria bacterium]|nr:oleate hydratase [Deltaproteobacteria bacterium]
MKKVCIIGGGFAGLASAVFLDNLGFEVTLFEKKPILGGRAYAFQDKKTGDWVDNGQHLLIGAYHETLKLLGNIGATRHLKIPEKTEVTLISDLNKP